MEPDSLTGGPFKRNMIFQGPVRFHVDWWEATLWLTMEVDRGKTPEADN